ncbi:MAG: hypothetical protein QUS09_05430, partial [Methanotrichaceae archaeon]|nr:hypothetical protein [Methanotrichaceae archaeon]
MLLNRLLGLGEEENVFLAEESLEDLISLPVTSGILEEGLDHEGCIEIDGKAIAVRLTEPAEFWLVLTDRYSKRKILEEHLGHQFRKGCQKVSATESEFFTA